LAGTDRPSRHAADAEDNEHSLLVNFTGNVRDISVLPSKTYKEAAMKEPKQTSEIADPLKTAEDVLQRTALTAHPVKFGGGSYLSLLRTTQERLDAELTKQHELAEALTSVAERITEVYQAELMDATTLLKRKAAKLRKKENG
jgi:hypothetical protein